MSPIAPNYAYYNPEYAFLRSMINYFLSVTQLTTGPVGAIEIFGPKTVETTVRYRLIDLTYLTLYPLPLPHPNFTLLPSATSEDEEPISKPNTEVV